MSSYYNNDATHNEFQDAILNGGQHWYTNVHYPGDGGRDIHDRERAREVLGPLVAKLETNSFLDRLLPMIDHVAQISETSTIDPDDPKLYWILRDGDFKAWGSPAADRPQVLWIFDGPPGCSMAEVSSFIAKQAASPQNGGMFYFSCSIDQGSDVTTTFTHSFLRHILNGSNPRQAKLIIEKFLIALLFKIIQRDQSRFKGGSSAGITVEDILRTRGPGLLEALTEAVGEMDTIPDTPIIIDGIHKIGPDGARFLARFCSHQTGSRKLKMLLTSRPDPNIQKEVDFGTQCIILEYDKERQECLNSLRHHGTRYGKIETEHYSTLQWLWEHENYRAWSSTSQSDLLLIEGKPGSGKSTLTKYFKDNLLEREPLAKQAIVASFFYSHREGEAHTNHSNMLRSVLYDVLRQNETFFFHFQSVYRERLPHDVLWTYDSLKQILLSFKDHPVKEKLLLIIDAMDESDPTDRHDIIQLLHQLCTTKNLCIVKVFVASRPIARLSHCMPDIKNVIKLEDENKPDILKFTESFLDELGFPTTSRASIKDFIMDHACGVFIWVRLVQMELLKFQGTGYRNQNLYDFLQSLPKELDEFYERMLRGLEDNDNQQDVNDGVRMFQLVLFAYRPLRIAEMQQALAVADDQDAEYSPSDKSFEDQLVDDIVKRIIHCGGNFLDIRGNDIVQFTHQTALTFFSQLAARTSTSKFRMNEADSRRHISNTCIKYLMLCVSSTRENEPPRTKSWEPTHFEKYAEYLNSRPFIDYALCHFQQHKNHCDGKRKNGCHQCIYDKQLVCQLRKKLISNSASLLFESWIESYLGGKGVRQNVFHAVRRVGLQIERWVGPGRGQSVDANEKRPAAAYFRNTLLHIAVEMKYSQAVEALLTTSTEKKGGVRDKTLLLKSAEAGDIATAEVLLRNGACIDEKNNKGRTALLLAAANGHDTMVRLLVNSGANKEARDIYQETALHYAVWRGHESTVRLLVQTLDAEIEAKSYLGSTVLHSAASRGDNSMVKLLSTLGASIEGKDLFKRTALHRAALSGHNDTIELLVGELGANREAVDQGQHTALHFAAFAGHESTARLLVTVLQVNKGAENDKGKTALHLTQQL